MHSPSTLWMPRPLHLNEPGWVYIDLDLTRQERLTIERAARSCNLPVNVFIRSCIECGLDALEARGGTEEGA